MSVSQVSQVISFASKNEALACKKTYIGLLEQCIVSIKDPSCSDFARVHLCVNRVLNWSKIERGNFETRMLKIGEADNNTTGVVSFVREMEQSGGITKVATVFFSRLLVFLGFATLFFGFAAFDAASEYRRQNIEAATKKEMSAQDETITRLESELLSIQKMDETAFHAWQQK
ncbi:MAG: hypothetical protein ACHQT8_01960 [Chlamydiales bacterium]